VVLAAAAARRVADRDRSCLDGAFAQDLPVLLFALIGGVARTAGTGAGWSSS
jgi:hypothetical protein